MTTIWSQLKTKRVWCNLFLFSQFFETNAQAFIKCCKKRHVETAFLWNMKLLFGVQQYILLSPVDLKILMYLFLSPKWFENSLIVDKITKKSFKQDYWRNRCKTSYSSKLLGGCLLQRQTSYLAYFQTLSNLNSFDANWVC